MKKSFGIVVLASIMLYSCSTYTCATYARKAPEKAAKQAKI